MVEVLKDEIKTLVDPVSLLEFLGFDISIKNSHEVRAPCAIHGGDNPTAFRMKLDTKRFSCYSHKCEFTDGRVDNDVFALVMKVKKIGFKQAAEFLADFVGLSGDSSSVSSVRSEAARAKHIANAVREVRSIKKPVLAELNQKMVDKFMNRQCGYFTKLGVSEATKKFFELGSMVDAFGIERATVPIRDAEGRLVSISGRRTDGDDDPRYLLLRDFKKHFVAYNLNNASLVAPAFNNCVIVVEGFKAVWAVHAAGYGNVVAVMGSVVLESQAKLLSEAGFTRCLLMLDGDEAGHEGVKTSFPVVSKYMKTKVVPLYEEFGGMSPDDFDSAVLGGIIENEAKGLMEGFND